MVKSRLLAIVGALFFICFSLLFWILKTNQNDRSTYLKLEEAAATKQENQLTYSQQKRKGMCKEVFYQQGKEKLQFRILSEDSTLFLFHENNQMEIVEEMEKVQCTMQEELFYLLPDGREAVLDDGKLIFKKNLPKDELSWLPLNTPDIIPMQIIRYLEAEKACYNYNSHLFVANAVKMWRYRIPGHELIVSIKGLHPFMSGIAKSVEFSLDKQQFNFTAQQFKATFETTTTGEL